VKLAFAAEINNPLSGEKSPISDYTGCDRALYELGIANCICLGAADGRYDFRRREFLHNWGGSVIFSEYVLPLDI